MMQALMLDLRVGFRIEPSGGYDLSVILPAYNSENWIARAVDSVIEQVTDFRYEVILIDDGSTDKTASIIDNYKENPIVVVIHQKNKGFSGARNVGLDKASGHYIMFVDSDDYLEANAIQSLMSVATDENADVVAGNYTLIRENGSSYMATGYKNEKIEPMGKLFGQPWGKVYNHNLFKNLQFPLNYWYEDSIFSQIVWPMARNCYTIECNVYNYLENSKGITASSTGRVKAIDSFYITSSLLYDKKLFGLQIGIQDYNYFLSMVKLTYNRTKRLSNDIKKAIFICQCNLRDEFFSEFSAVQFANIEAALIARDYKSYVISCR